MRPERKEYRRYEDAKTIEHKDDGKQKRNDHKHNQTCAKNRKNRKKRK